MTIISAENREEWMARQAQERPPAERRAFLETTCAGDAALLQRVVGLMRAKEDVDLLERGTAIDVSALRRRVEAGVQGVSSGCVSSPAAGPYAPPSRTSNSPVDWNTRRVVNSDPLGDRSLSSVRGFGDYELLEEVARGGMGVVYRARQVGLNRIVAIKMILAGRFANENEIKRFRIEAEAAANLQHANIVAIHEIGEHQGQHYFSMDYVEGRNLAQVLREGPLEPRTAAEYVKTIAEAVHYAHQRGTLHRDLKPQNILIDSHGHPRVTDFGLAKREGAEGGLTCTAAVMGTPAYMPPEQAMGRQDLVGPHSDVYSLGAILYQLLTGNVPFVADSPLATLRRVLEDQVPAPRKLNANTPPDLETICLKCLEKRPERRYYSARELAEELERFLNETPILARPANWRRKAWSWTARNPWALTGASSLLALGFIALAFGLWEHNQFLHSVLGHAQTGPGITNVWAAVIGFGVFFGLLCAPFCFAAFVDHKRKGMPMGEAQYWAYGLLGTIGVFSSVGVVLAMVRGYAWEEFNFREPASAVMIVFSLPGAWFGSLLLWHLGRHYYTACYARQDLKEKLLFPAKGQGPVLHKLVSQRQQFNRYGWALVVILAAALLHTEQQSMFLLLACGAAAIPVLAAWYMRTTSANRHLILFGILWCFLAGVVQILILKTSRRVANPALPTPSYFHQLFAVSFGVICGSVVAWRDRQPGQAVIETADLPLMKAMKRRALVKVSSNSWFFFCVVMFVCVNHVLLGPMLFPSERGENGVLLGWLVFFSALLPFQVACWRRAAGPERLARLNSVAVSCAVSVVISLANHFEQCLKAVVIGLAMGLLLLGILLGNLGVEKTPSRN